MCLSYLDDYGFLQLPFRKIFFDTSNTFKDLALFTLQYIVVVFFWGGCLWVTLALLLPIFVHILQTIRWDTGCMLVDPHSHQFCIHYAFGGFDSATIFFIDLFIIYLNPFFLYFLFVELTVIFVLFYFNTLP